MGWSCEGVFPCLWGVLAQADIPSPFRVANLKKGV